jgi:MiaB/RimO family radical SAM methylthiotransferase
MNSFHILTFGCTFNQADSEKISTILQKNNMIQVDEKIADLLIINTCAVKQTTELKLLHLINEKIKSYPQKKFIICGCLPQIDEKIKEMLIQKLDSKGVIVHPHEILHIFEKVQSIGITTKIENLNRNRNKTCMINKICFNKSIGIVQISEGCNNKCAYCCTRNARGSLYCFNNQEILKQIEFFLQNGIQEIFLTSQDLGNYQYNGLLLHDLIKDILEIPKDFKLRLGMFNPNYIIQYNKKLLDLFSDNRLYRFIHVPIQSGSKSILNMMNRPIDIDKFIVELQKYREFDPYFTIATDIITGFPSESDEDHQLTISLLNRIQFDVTNISKYTNRPNTTAKLMKQVPSDIIKFRSNEITEVVEKIVNARLNKWIGVDCDVFFNEFHPNSFYPYMGRNLYYKPILSKNAELGKSKKMRISNILNHSLVGEDL